jgi:hypothetical protein
MKSWIGSLLAGLLFLPNLRAAPVIDQEYLVSNATGYILDYPGDCIAQTFTVRNSGRLVSLGVQVSKSGYPWEEPVTADLVVRLVRTTPTGVPDVRHVLASNTISRFDVPDELPSDAVLNMDLADDGIHVQQGDILAIAISSNHAYYSHPNHTQYVWHGRTHNPHPGGAFYIYSPALFGPEPHLVMDRFPSPTRDMGFRILIEVPEPTPTIILAFGVMFAGTLLSRRSIRSTAITARKLI